METKVEDARGLPGLRDARLEALMSQRALSDKSGVTQGTISNLETGKTAAAGLTVVKLARALGVEPSDLRE